MRRRKVEDGGDDRSEGRREPEGIYVEQLMGGLAAVEQAERARAEPEQREHNAQCRAQEVEARVPEVLGLGRLVAQAWNSARGAK